MLLTSGPSLLSIKRSLRGAKFGGINSSKLMMRNFYFRKLEISRSTSGLDRIVFGLSGILYRLEKSVLHYHGNWLGVILQPEDTYFSSQFGLSEHRRLSPSPQGWGTKENIETVLSESYSRPRIVLFLVTLSHEILVMILSQ